MSGRAREDSLDEDDWVVAVGILSSSEEATTLVPRPEQTEGHLSSSSGAGASLPPPAQATADVGQGAADSSPIPIQTPLSKMRVTDLVRHHHGTMLQRPELLSDCDMALGLVLSILLLKYHQNLDDDLGPLLPEQTTYCQLKNPLIIFPFGLVYND